MGIWRSIVFVIDKVELSNLYSILMSCHAITYHFHLLSSHYIPYSYYKSWKLFWQITYRKDTLLKGVRIKLSIDNISWKLFWQSIYRKDTLLWGICHKHVPCEVFITTTVPSFPRLYPRQICCIDILGEGFRTNLVQNHSRPYLG